MQPVFKNLTAEDPDQEPTEVESLCVDCGENGTTTLLLTKIPHYREVILMSFFCASCGFRNNEIQSGGRIQELGVSYEVTVRTIADLSRQVVKSDHATLSVPDVELEIPADSQKGTISNVEGVLRRTIEGLTQDQPVRRHTDPTGAEQIDRFVDKIGELLEVREPFKVVLTDPSGNSFVENPRAPNTDPDRVVSHFPRTKEQDHALGIFTEEELAETQPEESKEESEAVKAQEASQKLVRERAQNLVGDGKPEELNLEAEVLKFPTNCPDCNAPAATNMKVTNIPHFKEVIIMATLCDYCGHKTNEVKSGGGIEAKGTRITLNVKGFNDMSRDLLKAECCSLEIPELDFHMGGFALGGRFTTLEGLLQKVVDQLDENPMFSGDSATEDTARRFGAFKARLERMKKGEEAFTLILDDPTGNSYLENPLAPEDDPEMTVERYERTHEHNDSLGLNDMKTEGYEGDLDAGGSRS